MIGKMTIQEVAKILVEKNNLTQRDANKFATEMFAVIQHGLEQDGQAKVKGLGTFKIIDVEARESVSVRTGERVVIDGHSKVTFTPDAMMKELVNRPFSQFETVVLNDGVEFEDIPEEPEEEESEMTGAIEAKDTIETIDSIDAIEVTDQPAETEPAEPQPVAEPEPLPVSEPESQPQPIKSTEPVVESKPAPTSQPADAAVKSLTPDDKPLEIFVDEEPAKKPSWKQWLLAIAGVLVLMALSAVAGYQYGRSTLASDDREIAKNIVPDTVAKADTAVIAKSDSITTEQLAGDTMTTTVATATAAEQSVAKETPKPQQEVEDIWSQKDDRVRLGYYRIIGTDRTVTVQAGQTFRGICKSHLGPGMECYVEVYNNLPKNPTVKEGQVLKIPKLEVRKKLKNLRKKNQE
jgi:nucleoid DNA-binding protein